MWKSAEIHPGEYLKSHFLVPLGLSASELARRCQVPRSRVSDILAGRRAITADTALRLAAFFRMEPEFWMGIQAEWDLQQVGPGDLVVPLDPPGFLVGPAGATPLPARQRARPPHLRLPRERLGDPIDVEEATTGDPVVHDEVRYADGTRALVARVG